MKYEGNGAAQFADGTIRTANIADGKVAAVCLLGMWYARDRVAFLAERMGYSVEPIKIHRTF